MLQLAAVDPEGPIGIVVAVISFASAVFNWLEKRAAKAERDTHAADAAETRVKLGFAHEGLECFHTGAIAYQKGASPLESVLLAVKSPGAQALLEHLVTHGKAPAIPPPPAAKSPSAASVLTKVGVLLFTIALIGCSAAQLAVVEADAHAVATVGQATLVAFQSHEVEIGQLVSAVATVVAKSPKGSAAAAKVQAGLAEVQAHPEATDLLEEGLAELAAGTASTTSPATTK